MLIVIVAIVSIASALKWGDKKNWQSYYSTIIFFIAADLAYNALSVSKRLWEYSGFLPHEYIGLFVMLTIYPSVMLIFLPKWPSGVWHQVVHILKWVVIFSAVEWILSLFGELTYHNGWSFWFSVLFDCVMFPLLILHHKRPLLAWPLAIGVGAVILYSFHIPVS
ncbi:MAG TPA: CBO0543 family protein [Syntrophomonadaceae bacterium]|nr:CBO0543 family protein [Syntrophomonadaceae bacterium]